MASYNSNLNAVKKHLDSDERIIYSCIGGFEREINGKKMTINNGIMLVTEARVVVFCKKLIGYIIESFPIENISSIRSSVGLLGWREITLRLSGSGHEVRLNKIQTIRGLHDSPDSTETRFAPDQLVDYVRNRMGASPDSELSAKDVNIDLTEQIRKLAELRDAGILDEEEYAAKKSELLSRI